MSNISLVLIYKYIVHLRCCDDRRMMFSRNVFCGATNPRRPPGMIFFNLNETIVCIHDNVFQKPLSDEMSYSNICKI